MATHPYISGPGNIQQMVSLLRKNFPSVVTADTVKKYGLAPNNESYVINSLQFLGVIDADGRKTELGTNIFTKHEDGEFQDAFGNAVKSAYSDLFELHGDAAWSLEKPKLIGYFRQSDKTSETIGGRQASVFQVFAALAGREPFSGPGLAQRTASPKKSVKPKPRSREAPAKPSTAESTRFLVEEQSNSALGLNVKIEVNLPAGADPTTYDAIFRSIREHLMNAK